MNGLFNKKELSEERIKKVQLFSAIREKIQEGYTASDFKSDIMSGLVVCMVAIPLAMALAIASGVPPQYGLYTVIFGGATVALLGGSRFQVTGPTAAFVVVLAPVAQSYGIGGLLFAGMLAGIILVVMGIMRMGRMIQFIPYPVTTGFTAGIAVVIAILQLKDFLGVKVDLSKSENIFGKLFLILEGFPSISPYEMAIGVLTIFCLILWPKVNKKIPAPLVALCLGTFGAILVKVLIPEVDISTLGNRFSYSVDGVVGNGIPQALPSFSFPWNYKSVLGNPFVITYETFRAILPSAFAIAILGAIESLLSAVVADGMANTKHDPDSELIALGIGNIICPFFGGIAATGAIARTATNIRYGAKSPISSILHAIFTLIVILLFAPFVSFLPMASMAALLLIVAYNMSEAKHFMHILRVAPKSDVLVLLTCFFLTIIFDMVIGVSVGVVLASLLFMKRMAQVTTTQLLDFNTDEQKLEHISKNTVVYKVGGPLFFGAAEIAAETMSNITDDIKVVIFSMHGVPIIDVTGLVALESAFKKLSNRGRYVLLTEVNDQVQELLNKSNILNSNPQFKIFKSLDEANKFSSSI
ncbi:MAG: C4-dicarboxylic acid transporter DauA [Bacteriovoracaceae bacterium]|jgi:SulP family sulfate permease|nr:C4-dicarboxylic acid transporter DauA [Bacteriovoracaceae bacterium]